MVTLALAWRFTGSTCTGLKLLWVSRSNADAFVSKLAAIDKLAFGMPWDPVMLTPLPEPDKPERLARLVANATSNGAQVANEYGGLTRYSFYFPSVVYPVRPSMALYSEEQFGPVVPVAVYDDLSQVIDWMVAEPYGQQASLFGHDPNVIGPLIDVMVNQVESRQPQRAVPARARSVPVHRAQGLGRRHALGHRCAALLLDPFDGGGAQLGAQP